MALNRWFTTAFLGLSSYAVFAAEVNPNNGNFHVPYRDIYVSTQGLTFDFTRTYNSRSNFIRGLFGVGWSSELDSFIRVEGDKIIYHEGGGGNQLAFEKTKDGNWSNKQFGLQSIQLNNKNYVLSTGSGKDLVFTNDGKLSRIQDKNNNYQELVYVSGRLKGVKDGRTQMRIETADFGGAPRITLIEMKDTKARFEYSRGGDLIKSVGQEGIPYSYSYDDEHNLTRIEYKDGTYRSVGYNKSKDWATSHREPNGRNTKYDYFSDAVDPENKFGTTLQITQDGSKESEVIKFWYEFAKRPDGSRYNHRAVSSYKGQVTETIFTECCGTPQAITQWKVASASKADEKGVQWTIPPKDAKSTFFQYNAKGFLVKKTGSAGIVTSISYDAATGKVASIERARRLLKYTYDKRGNLASAFDSQAQRRIDVVYDLNGRITSINETSPLKSFVPKSLYLKYNLAGRPSEVKEVFQKKESKIRLIYDEAGNMVGVQNALGRAIASQDEIQGAQRILGTFQSLLELAQPQGVTLTPDS